VNRLRPRLGYGWRVFATGLCFSTFGLGAAVLSATVFPLLALTAPSRAAQRRRIQHAMHYAFRLFVWMMKALGLLTYEVHGRERLVPPGQLVVANHPSLIDVVLLISLMPEVDCIVKRGLWRNPFLRWPVLWAAYIPNNEPQRLISDCAAALSAGHSLIVFPEGTRSVPQQPLTMKRGAAQIALAADAPIVPVTIVCQPSTLTKAEKWYQVPPSRPHWALIVGHPWRLSDLLPADLPPALAARQLTQHLVDHFTQNVRQHKDCG
jgi:1-acyl-sn-glycerol-3-phosphate acyltransferase